MKKKNILFIFALHCELIGFSQKRYCSGNFGKALNDSTQLFSEQLNMVKDTFNNKLYNSAVLKVLRVSDIHFIKSYRQKDSLFAEILSPDSKWILFDGINQTSMKLTRLGRKDSLASTINGNSMLVYSTENRMQNISNILESYRNSIYLFVTIKWRLKGEEFESICVGGNRGIIYDNVITNLLFLNSEERLEESK